MGVLLKAYMGRVKHLHQSTSKNLWSHSRHSRHSRCDWGKFSSSHGQCRAAACAGAPGGGVETWKRSDTNRLGYHGWTRQVFVEMRAKGCEIFVISTPPLLSHGVAIHRDGFQKFHFHQAVATCALFFGSRTGFALTQNHHKGKCNTAVFESHFHMTQAVGVGTLLLS